MRQGGIFQLMILECALLLPSCFAQQSAPRNPESCAGLHAGIQAQIGPGYEAPSVMLSFVLLNDSASSLDVDVRSWGLVIDGKEIESGMLFGNGPVPARGFRILTPGEAYEFGRSLPIMQYFHAGQHTIRWKGAGFQSPTINVTTSQP